MGFAGKNVLVTGATGLLGGHLVSALLREKASVVAIVRDSVPECYLKTEGLDRKIRIVQGQLEDYSLVERTLNEYEVEAAFHLGAQTIVRTANRSPLSTFQSNIKGTWNVLEAARNSALLQALVVASTDKVYGESSLLPYTEEHPLLASHPYDVSKACADMLSSSYFRTYGLPVGVTRCGNIFGAGDLNFNRIIPGTIRSVAKKERPVIRSDGKMVRDYVYVEDIADANLLLCGALLSGKEKGESFNFSYSKPKTVLEVVDAVQQAMGSALKPIVENKASNEIPKQYLSAAKAQKKLGWKPKWSLESGLRPTVDWYNKYLG